MRILIFWFTAAATAWAQSSAAGSWSLHGSEGPGPQVVVVAQSVALPTTWVNTHEGDVALNSPNVTITLPVSGTGGAWVGGGPYTTNTCATGINQAVTDAESYRSTHLTANILIQIPPGTVYGNVGSTPCVTLPQTAADTNTPTSGFIALATTGTLAAGVTVCAHGIQDNVSASTDIGTRNPACTSPNDVAQMWTVQAPGAGFPLVTGPCDVNGVGPHHFVIMGGEFRQVAADTGAMFTAIRIGDINRGETTLGCLPSHIYMDRLWLHGDRTDAFAGSNKIQHVIMLDCNICSVENSQISQTIYPGNESQGIVMDQSQTIKIVHNWIEGPSEDVFCGGVNVNIPNIQACNDTEIRRNRLSYPFAWLAPGSAQWPGTTQSMVRKNGLEMKSAQRVLIDGNIMENVDDSGSQQRPFGMNPKAQNTAGPQYFTNVININFTNNIARNICNSGAFMGTRSSPPPNGQGTSEGMQNVLIQNLLYYNAERLSFCNPVDSAGNGFQWGPSDTQFAGCTAQRDAAGLTTTLTCVNGGIGTAQTDTNVGDPVWVSACADTSFNVGDKLVMGPPALAGTNHDGLVIVYANPGTANATTTGCTFDNFQSFPKSMIISHNTFIFSSASQGIYVGKSSGGTAFAQNGIVTDNIILGQGVGGQGLSDSSTPTVQATAWDLATTIWHHNLYVGRTSACSHYLDIVGLGGPRTGPVSSFCPSTPYCTTNDPTAGSCVGFNGLMSIGALNIDLPDWHGYRLCHAGDASCANPSLYAAGQTNPASDGTDRGAAFSSIDSAQTQTQYACSSACGSGPFPD
jgi:hypothetical protein